VHHTWDSARSKNEKIIIGLGQGFPSVKIFIFPLHIAKAEHHLAFMLEVFPLVVKQFSIRIYRCIKNGTTLVIFCKHCQ